MKRLNARMLANPAEIAARKFLKKIPLYVTGDVPDFHCLGVPVCCASSYAKSVCSIYPPYIYRPCHHSTGIFLNFFANLVHILFLKIRLTLQGKRAIFPTNYEPGL
jgi:hypothetical protein